MSFSIGAAVRTTDRARGHTRLPRYLAQKHGVVTAILGTFALPDSVVAGGSRPEALYTVRFDASHLFDSTSADAVYADLFESYLEADR